MTLNGGVEFYGRAPWSALASDAHGLLQKIIHACTKKRLAGLSLKTASAQGGQKNGDSQVRDASAWTFTEAQCALDTI